MLSFCFVSRKNSYLFVAFISARPAIEACNPLEQKVTDELDESTGHDALTLRSSVECEPTFDLPLEDIDEGTSEEQVLAEVEVNKVEHESEEEGREEGREDEDNPRAKDDKQALTGEVCVFSGLFLKPG